jgi:hypothetical protein
MERLKPKHAKHAKHGRDETKTNPKEISNGAARTRRVTARTKGPAPSSRGVNGAAPMRPRVTLTSLTVMMKDGSVYAVPVTPAAPGSATVCRTPRGEFPQGWVLVPPFPYLSQQPVVPEGEPATGTKTSPRASNTHRAAGSHGSNGRKQKH